MYFLLLRGLCKKFKNLIYTYEVTGGIVSLPKELWLPWWLRQLRICLPCGRPVFDPWIGKIPWKREWQPTTVFLPGKSYGQGSLVGYSPWGIKESDMTEQLT